MVARNHLSDQRTTHGREDSRDVNLGVIHVPVRGKINATKPMPGVRAPSQSPLQRRLSLSNARSVNTRSIHTRSVVTDDREGPPTYKSSSLKQPQNHYERECDYDNNATTLYELLESSAWEKARIRCRTHPEEVRTWIVRRDKSSQVRWKLLPLHAAIIFQSPSIVISSILERYPVAATRQDDQGMLPLHLAFRHKQEDEDLLELLLLENPRAVHQKDRRDRTPLEHGRECRYSAKLVRLYAEAAVSTASTTNHQNSKTDMTHATQTTAPSSPSLSLKHLHRVEMEHDAKVAKVRADYDQELEKLKNLHVAHLENMKDEWSVTRAQLDKQAERERRDLQNHYESELNELRRELSHLQAKKEDTTEYLQNEIVQLQAAVEEARRQEESMAEKYGKLITVNVQMRHFLDDIAEEQSAMQEMAHRQQQYLEAARMMRTELVQTLLKQEDSDGVNERLKGTHILEIGDRVQRKINEFVQANVVRSDSSLSRTDYKGRNRIDAEHDHKIYLTKKGGY